MAKVCKKCGYERQLSDIAPEYECPKCQAIYAKVEERLEKKRLEEEKRLKKQESKLAKLMLSISSRWKNTTIVELFYLGISWIFGTLFLLMGAVSLIDSPLAGLCLIGISALLLPPVRTFIYSKTNMEMSAKVRAIAIFVLFIAFGAFIGQNQEKKAQELAAKKTQEQTEKLAKIKQENIDYFRINRDKIISSVKSALAAQEYQSVISQSTKYLAADDAELNQLYGIAKSRLNEIQKAEKTEKLLAENEIQKAEKTEKLLAEIKATPTDEYEKNKNLYQQLAGLHPDNESYSEKVVFYSQKIEEGKKKQLAAEARKKQIETQFSAWDGSHRGLERVIKESMNDPDSYDHVETVYWDRGDHLVVQTTFRGKNAFGGVVKNSVKAKVSLNGQVLQILDR
jgi:hypothetical protein